MSAIEDLFELSPMQHGLLSDTLGAPGAGMHMVQLVYELGDLDVAAFERAWRATAERHPLLRTSFQWEDLEKPLQVVHRDVDLALRAEDWSHLSPEEERVALERLLVEDRGEAFPLDAAPVTRLVLRRLGGARHWFLWSFHHILFEGWSASIVLRDMLALYRAEVTGEPAALRDPPRYGDYIRWIQEQDPAPAEAFWRRELAGFERATPLPGRARSRTSVHQVTAYDVREVRLSVEESERLSARARALRVTLNTLLQGAWAILTSRTSGESDVLFGTIVSGRSAPLPDVERIVGLFVNLLPSRVNVDARAPTGDWLRELQTNLARVREYEHLPLVRIKGWSEIPAGEPLFETLLVFENWLGDVTLEDGSDVLEVRGVTGHQHGGPGFPLSLVVWQTNRLSLALSYDTSLFEGEEIERLLGLLTTVLRSLASEDTATVGEVRLLTPDEERALVRTWNPPAVELPPEPCIHHLFERQVRRTPDAVAVVFRDRSLTYRELGRRAHRLAHRLRALGVRAESRVGICMERSLELPVAIWGVLEAGGAYVPFDPALPEQRVSFVLEDARIRVFVTQRALVARLPAEVEHVVCLDPDEAALDGFPDDAPDTEVGRANLAFMTYTSGSTGQPKGSMVLHEGLVNAFVGWDRAYSLGDVRSHLAVASFGVDVFSADVVRAHGSGGRLVIAPHEVVFSPPRLAQLLVEERIELVEFVPHVLEHLVAHLESTGETLDDVALLIIGSDVCLGSDWARMRAVCRPDVRLINAYGLNETSVDCTYFEDASEDVPPRAYVPIGKPYANHRVYVLDALGRPVPRGVPGELFIGGLGVVRGYWNRPAETAERFLPDPFSPRPGARMLRTGDRVRELEDGNLEILGRVDQQVKIRAFRVELGEVEAALQEHPAVDRAVALVRADDDGERQLVAYLVGEASLSAAEVRAHLADQLPSHMIPGFFVFLDELPLTSNRLKVDRAALPAPEWSARPSEEDFVEPESEIERYLAEVWIDVLPVERVGALDRFMDLGGHSLLLVPVLARVERDLGLRLLPGEIILSNLRQLAASVETRLAAPAAERPRGLLARLLERG